MIKMNTLLATLEHAAASCTKMLQDYARFFKNNQGSFLGYHKTHTPREGYVADPTKIGTQQVVTTVDEKFDWFMNQLEAFLKQLFAVERTNSLGANTVPLIVDGKNFGELTALELMRLKSFLTRPEFEQIYNNIPVRADNAIWDKSNNANYTGRDVWETPLVEGITRTTEKEEVILRDPNLDPAHLPANYQARTTIKSKVVETGDYTLQNFSGEWSHRQRAELLRKRSAVLEAVVAALKVVNDNTAVESALDVRGLLEYIHKN